MATNIKVYRGHQIGGCVVMISTEEAKICIDFGESLPGNEDKEDEIRELNWAVERADAVFFTHYHGDHMGRFMSIPTDIPLYMGDVTRKVMLNIQKALKHEAEAARLSDTVRIHELEADKTITIKDIKVTPYLVDHSAYDAYMFLIETPDKTIVHTGDYREHGYRGKALIPMIQNYITCFGKRQIDILITEGTMMSRQGEKIYTERQMQEDAKKLFADHRYVFLLCSSTNLDSLASFYHAAEFYHMGMYANSYVFSQLKTFSETAGKKTSLYNFRYAHDVRFDFVLPGVHMTQEEFMRKNGFVTIISARKGYEKWIERFADLHPIVIYSMWKEYLNPEHKAYRKEWHDFVEKYHAIPMHTSGHAPASVIARVINEIHPKEAIIPIHTENAGDFKDLDILQELKDKLIL